MEKRKKSTTPDDYLAVVDDLSALETSDEVTMKSKAQITPFILFFSFAVIIFVYFVYVVVLGPNKNLPSLTVHIPALKEDIDIHIPSIQKDSLPIFEQKIVPDTPVIVDNIDINVISNNKSIESEEQLQTIVDSLINSIRAIKQKHIAIELTKDGLELKQKLQKYVKELLIKRYGPGPYLIEMKLRFPDTMDDYLIEGPTGVIVIELGPIDLIPYSVYYFLDIIRNWKGGHFHRAAGHVLQAQVLGQGKGLAFQEYHPDYPHKPLTLGYAGRPGGPAFYINIVDNIQNHGPGSQGSQSEADSCFGRVLVGESVVKRMKRQPGKTKPMGFIDSKKNYITIESIQLVQKA